MPRKRAQQNSGYLTYRIASQRPRRAVCRYSKVAADVIAKCELRFPATLANMESSGPFEPI